MDPRQVWFEGLMSDKTRATYRLGLKRHSDVSGLSHDEMLDDARRDMKQFWVRIKRDASKLRPHMRAMAICAV